MVREFFQSKTAQTETGSCADNTPEKVADGNTEASSLNWLQLNILNPAVNSGIIDSHNALANAVNDYAGGHLSKWQERQVGQAGLGSKEWLAQTVSSGLAGILPYVASALIVRKPLSIFADGAASINLTLNSEKVAYRLKLQDKALTTRLLQVSLGGASRLLRSQHTSAIVGAAVYDSLRDTNNSETHTGNAFGGAAAFGVFQAGNYLSRALPLEGRLIALAATGALGAVTQASVAKEVSTGALPSRDELASAALSGMVMNMALPTAQFMGSHMVESVNMKIARGEPLNRFITQRDNAAAAEISGFGRIFSIDTIRRQADADRMFRQAFNQSPLFTAAVDRNYSARILENAGVTSYVPKIDQVKLAADNKKPDSIVHELTHREQYQSGRMEASFSKAQKLLGEGKTEEAVSAYVEARVGIEREALEQEDALNQQLQQGGKSENYSENNLKHSIALDAIRKTAIEESRLFVQSNGEFRPTEYFQKDIRNNSVLVDRFTDAVNKWHETPFKEKLQVLATLNQATPELRLEIFQKAIFETEAEQKVSPEGHEAEQLWSLREAADKQFKNIASGDRKRLFNSLLASDDYFLRLIALSHIKDLPASERLIAFKEVLKDKKALAVPTPQSRIYDYDGSYRPWVWTKHKDALNVTLHKLPSELLVESITALKSSDRKTAWDLAYSHSKQNQSALESNWTGNKKIILVASDTKVAALSHLEVLPASERFAVWSKEFEKFAIGVQDRTLSSRFGHLHKSKIIDTFLFQIPKLPEVHRDEAMHQIFATSEPLGAVPASQAFTSLHPDDRMPTWEKFFARSAPDWGLKSSAYESYFFLDKLRNDLYGRDISNAAISAWEKRREEFTGINYSNNYQFIHNTIGINRGLASAIPTLDPGIRFDAWERVLAMNPGRTYINDLTSAIPSLPEAYQRLALQKIFSRASELDDGIPENDRFSTLRERFRFRPEHPVKPIGLAPNAFAASVEQLDLAQWSMMIEVVLSLPPSDLRTSLVKSIPMSSRISNDVRNLNVSEVLPHYKEIFATATKIAKPEDFETLSQWWQEIIILEQEDFETGTFQSTVRENLATSIEPQYLAQLIFQKQGNPDIDTFAHAHPEIVPNLIKHSTFSLGCEGQSSFDHLTNALHVWNKDYSLAATTEALIKPIDIEKDEFGNPIPPAYELISGLYGELFKESSSSERRDSLELLKNDLFKADPNANKIHGSGDIGANTTFIVPLRIAAQAEKIDSALTREAFSAAVEGKLHDSDTPFAWKLALAREIANMQREKPSSFEDISLPDLRLPKINGLSEFERRDLQKQFVTALFDEDAMKLFIGDGPLGKLMPEHFGNFDTDGGIVGRPQHSGHDFALDVHTLKVMRNIRDNPEFALLPSKQQEDLLAAAFMHDLPKLPNTVDANHDWIAPKLAWGILSTMDMPPVRIQRIANLMARHTDASFSPKELHSAKLSDPAALDDLATFYRHPYALKQLRIFNEADIKAIHQDSHLWKPEVEQELDKIQELASPQVAALNENLVPILTSELPNRFTFTTMQKPYALLAHVSNHIQDSFLKQLNLIQSNAFSASTSLITDTHRKFYYDGQPVFALFGGPWEQISQAYRQSLGTGVSIDWRDHVELSRDWLISDRAVSFAKEIDGAAKRSKFPKENTGSLRHLASARNYFAEFDSFDELVNSQGIHSRQVQLQRNIHRALTSDAEGNPLEEHNEIKLNSPTFIGLGLARDSKPVHFESMPYDILCRLFSNTGSPPTWATGENAVIGSLPKNTITISPTLWKELVVRDLPIVSLDD